MIVNLINGPADGMILEYYTLPERIIMPCLPYFPVWDEQDQDKYVVISQVVYQRVGDTLEYICISEPKGDENEY